MTTTAANRYLSGMYAPVAEEVTAFDLPVQGELPVELDGRYLRNGPNPPGPVDPAAYHWFIGDGMVHGLRLREGRAEWYRNRYVGGTRTPNTNVGGLAGTTWALVEAGGCPVELTYELESVGDNPFFGTLPNGFTAHPKVDPSTGEMHAVAYTWPDLVDHVQYLVVGPDAKVRRCVDVPVAGMTMIHDMSLTERYAVIYDQPVTVDIELALQSRFPFRWNPDYGNRLGLLPREGEADAIIWVDAPLGYAYHPMNAYDTADGDVVIDLCVYQRMFATDLLGPFGDGLARLERWTVNPATRSLSSAVIDERPNEFPRHRGSLTGRPYRYGYCTSPSVDHPRWTTVKHDVQTGERWEYDHGEGRGAGEPVFVGRPDNEAEDDGWLLTFVHDAGNESTDFVVLDAQDLGRGPVARVPLPQRVPYGFHGNWVSDAAVPPA